MADEGYTDRLTPGGVSLNDEAVNAERNRLLLEDAVKGRKVYELADKYQLSERQVVRILKDAAYVVRQQSSELVARHFHLQIERLERLYRLVELELQAYEEYALARLEKRLQPDAIPVKFDDRPFRVAVMLFDRAAKLIGLDRAAQTANGRSGDNWMDDSPITEVVAYAKQLKMKVPTEFET